MDRKMKRDGVKVAKRQGFDNLSDWIRHLVRREIQRKAA